MRTLTADQLGAFFREVKAGGVFAPLYYLELATGLCRGGLLGLHWGEGEWARKAIGVRKDQQGKVGVGSVYVFPSTKGAPSPRTVFRTYSAGC